MLGGYSAAMVNRVLERDCVRSRNGGDAAAPAALPRGREQ
jgi:hypothetical protein